MEQRKTPSFSNLVIIFSSHTPQSTPHSPILCHLRVMVKKNKREKRADTAYTGWTDVVSNFPAHLSIAMQCLLVMSGTNNGSEGLRLHLLPRVHLHSPLLDISCRKHIWKGKEGMRLSSRLQLESTQWHFGQRTGFLCRFLLQSFKIAITVVWEGNLSTRDQMASNCLFDSLPQVWAEHMGWVPQSSHSLASKLESPATLDTWKNVAICEENSLKHHTMVWILSVPPKLQYGSLVTYALVFMLPKLLGSLSNLEKDNK